jgi:hypothetical protein
VRPPGRDARPPVPAFFPVVLPCVPNRGVALLPRVPLAVLDSVRLPLRRETFRLLGPSVVPSARSRRFPRSSGPWARWFVRGIEASSLSVLSRFARSLDSLATRVGWVGGSIRATSVAPLTYPIVPHSDAGQATGGEPARFGVITTWAVYMLQGLCIGSRAHRRVWSMGMFSAARSGRARPRFGGGVLALSSSELS